MSAAVSFGDCGGIDNHLQTEAYDNLGPESTDGRVVGKWGQNAVRPLMRLLGFIQEQYDMSTPEGTLRADYSNLVTRAAIDIKTGVESKDVLQASKYVLAKASGQLSDVIFMNIPNPWTGVSGGSDLASFVARYGFKLLPVFC